MKRPKILFYDIETSPNLGYTWQKYEQNVLRFVKERELLSVAYKWQGEPVMCLTRQGAPTDRELVKKVHKLFSEADIIIAHNGDAFDEKIVKARMLFHKLAPPKRTTSVDTKKVAKASFNFNGNGLDDLARFLKLGSKRHVGGIETWIGCMAGDESSWREMVKYNKQDVVLLEKVYDRLKPWILNHPNIARILNPTAHFTCCPTCGSKDAKKKGVRASHMQLRQQMHCNACGAWFLVRHEAA